MTTGRTGEKDSLDTEMRGSIQLRQESRGTTAPEKKSSLSSFPAVGTGMTGRSGRRSGCGGRRCGGKQVPESEPRHRPVPQLHQPLTPLFLILALNPRSSEKETEPQDGNSWSARNNLLPPTTPASPSVSCVSPIASHVPRPHCSPRRPPLSASGSHSPSASC